LLRTASKVSSAMSIVIEQLPEQKDVAPVERQDDDVSWMELNFVENDDNESLLPFAEHCAISVTLGGDDDDGDDDDDDCDEASLSSKEQKPSSYSKPTSRRRPKKTTLHKKSKSFDDTIMLGSDKKKMKKKKDKKKSKAGEDSEEFSSKSKRKAKKRASAFNTSTTISSDDDSLGESLESLMSSAHSGSCQRKGIRRSLSLSPKRDGRSGIVQKMSTRGAGLVKQISFRAKGLKNQLAQSEHGPSDRAGLMGQILYSGFDDGSDLEDELDFH
jgi:hypothetical protein